ncbi:MAG: glycosyltransferase [Coprobacter sp.]|nr:glycosyltransferase [Coprobacter sp.]
MKVSVIIPNYCHSRFLRERIDSVLAQTYEDFEIIILDDCSTDNSREIIESYRPQKKISHIEYNDKNSGSTFIQWKKGFELARGEYIWIAESDDFADRRFLELCLGALEQDTRCTVAYADSLYVDAQSRIISRVRKKKRKLYACEQGRRFVKKRMLRTNSIYNASMALFRRDALPASDDFTRYRYAGDWLFWAQVALSGKVVHVCRDLNYFRQHEIKVSNQARKDGLQFSEGYEVVHRIFEAAKISRPRRLATAGSYFHKMERYASRNGWQVCRESYEAWKKEYPCAFTVLLFRWWYKLID